MVTGVGWNAPSSCAAIRCGLANFTETDFVSTDGEPIVASRVTLEEPWQGLARLVHMIVPALREALTAAANVRSQTIPLLLCVAEPERPARLDGLDHQLLQLVQDSVGLEFHPESRVIPQGRVAGAMAMQEASRLIEKFRLPLCIVAGVDSFLLAGTLSAYQRSNRLLTALNSNGFLPGEAAGAVLVGPSAHRQPEPHALLFRGFGEGTELATVTSSEPLRGDGLVQAVRSAFADAGKQFAEVDFRINDSNGEQYWFKEAALMMTRLMRVRKPTFDTWHLADSIGETGAATVPCSLAVALAAARGGYAPGRGVLCHFGNDGGARAALVLETTEVGSA